MEKLVRPIYLDYAATTPVAPEVADCMQGCLTLDGRFANPASRTHQYGWEAEESVEMARFAVAELIGAQPRDLVWTSGATEANNLALKGFMQAQGAGHLVVSAIEHKAVLDTARWLAEQGFTLTEVMPDAMGVVSVEAVAAALRADTRLVSIMLVNNEVGTINDVAAIAQLCAERNIAFHVDAVQAMGRLPIAVKQIPVTMMSLSAHKMYGPKGIGALYINSQQAPKLHTQMHGGGQERGLRAGTLAPHQCVGMGEAARLAALLLESDAARIGQLRDQLWHGIAELPGVVRHGDPARTVCSHLNVGFSGLEGETLMLALSRLAISNGSACNSAHLAPSFVLRAMGVSAELALSSLRFSLGRFTTAQDIEMAIHHVRDVVLSLNRTTV